MRKKIIIAICAILIIAAVVLTILYINGKNKTSIILKMSQIMMDINSNKNTNVYLKQSGQEYGYAERYMLNGKEKIVTYYNEPQIKYTDIFSSSEVISYLEDLKSGKKIMCIFPYEDDLEDINEDPLNGSSNSKISEFFEIINVGLTTKVFTENIDGKECYGIGSQGDLEGTSTIYIDKDTYIPYRIDLYSDGKYITMVEYKYGVVTEDDVKPLDEKEFEMVSTEEFENYLYSE